MKASMKINLFKNATKVVKIINNLSGSKNMVGFGFGYGLGLPSLVDIYILLPRYLSTKYSVKC